MTPTAIEIRDAAFDLLKASPLFRVVTTNPEDLEPADQFPSLMIWAARETMRPSGDAVSGEPHYVNELTLVFDINLRRNQRADIPSALAQREQFVLNTLLCSPDWLNLHEGVTSIDSSQSMPRNGETWYGQSVTQMTLQYSSRWEPAVPDDYARTTLTTRPLGHDNNTPGITTVIDQVQP